MAQAFFKIPFLYNYMDETYRFQLEIKIRVQLIYLLSFIDDYSRYTIIFPRKIPGR
ncbi:hypothetical protein LZ11_00405 [Thermosediminibacter litoriperuensis]|uniref:Uncharacterized protein n=1 Tax=Thermosediminibacter litoriperuensis TaxID=291989 RepID=A0A5S5AYZ1_9FIRM|nr:hypothetical protein LZ11_00405 [Thermosediminibacter litoriperuensis]